MTFEVLIIPMKCLHYLEITGEDGIEIETLPGECENIHADVACSGGYEEMRKIIKEKSELHIWWD